MSSSINWNDIATAITQANAQANANDAARGQIIQPWQQFLLPLQINSNAPDVLMQQARDTNENYYGYLQQTGFVSSGSDQNIIIAAGFLFLFALIS